MRESIINIIYLIAAVLFITGLKGLTHPRTAVKGNLRGAMGMFLAIIVTLFNKNIVSFEIIIAGIIVGGAIGAILAVKIEMTSMPELVALFNGFGGGASILVAGAALIEATSGSKIPGLQLTIASVLSGIIGSVTFMGSIIAWAKLQGVMTGNAILMPGRHFINAIIVLTAIGFGVMVVMDPANNISSYWIIVAVACVLGITATIPIGGADMPVVISLLNSYSGLAAAATGFVLSNNSLIITGSLVGASGIILTMIMCKAMNRSLAHVLFGVLEAAEGSATADEVYAGKVKSTSAEEIAMLFDGAQRVVIVPGYGMAVSQAQHTVRDLATLLESMDIVVEYAIHPVAGRMPGHMNVLLAEANVDYDKLIEMDTINPTMSQCDVAIVVGANDVVNPVAREPKSAIAGMPIIDVDKARTVVVIKRSLSPGFAGIPNPLFALENSLMFFNDGKKAFIEIIEAVKEDM